MRKYLGLVLVIIFPYLIAIAPVCIFKGYFMKTIFKNNAYNLLLTLLVIYVAALLCALAVFIISIVKKRKPLELLHINLIIKLIHIPAYIFIFFIGLICLLTIFTFAISFIFMIFDGMTIFLSGLIGLGGVIRSLKEKKISKKEAVIHGFLQFIFCADVISSIIIFITVSKRERVCANI